MSICRDFLIPALSKATNTNDLAAIQQFATDIVNSFPDSITSVSMTLSQDKTRLTYCYQVLDNSKAWLSLWFSLAQFGLFHFVMFTMSRIFFIGM